MKSIDIEKLKGDIEVLHDLDRSLQLHSRGLDEVEDKRTQWRIEALHTALDLMQSVIDGTIFAGEKEIRDIIQEISWKGGRSVYEHYNIGYSPYHEMLAKALVGKVGKPQGNIGREELKELIHKTLLDKVRIVSGGRNPMPIKEALSINSIQVSRELADAILTKLNGGK